MLLYIKNQRMILAALLVPAKRSWDLRQSVDSWNSPDAGLRDTP